MLINRSTFGEYRVSLGPLKSFASRNQHLIAGWETQKGWPYWPALFGFGVCGLEPSLTCEGYRVRRHAARLDRHHYCLAPGKELDSLFAKNDSAWIGSAV